MSLSIILQISVNILLFVSLFIIWKKLKTPQKDDPRLSRGLQLLQSKIAVLEDLSDRTDRQVEQMIKLLENKAVFLQKKIHSAEDQLLNVENSIRKSKEVASIFQDKIPHEEIIERMDSIKYINAAQMAHEGASSSEIIEKFDISQGEAEFIVKVNKDELMFDANSLPEWAKNEDGSTAPVSTMESAKSESLVIENFNDNTMSPSNLDFANDLDSETPELDELRKVEAQFKKACDEHDQKVLDAQKNTALEDGVSQLYSGASELSKKVTQKASDLIQTNFKKLKDTQFLKDDEEVAPAAPTQRLYADITDDVPMKSDLISKRPKAAPVISPEEQISLSERLNIPKATKPLVKRIQTPRAPAKAAPTKFTPTKTIGVQPLEFRELTDTSKNT